MQSQRTKNNIRFKGAINLKIVENSCSLSWALWSSHLVCRSTLFARHCDSAFKAKWIFYRQLKIKYGTTPSATCIGHLNQRSKHNELNVDGFRFKTVDVSKIEDVLQKAFDLASILYRWFYLQKRGGNNGALCQLLIMLLLTRNSYIHYIPTLPT